ncbi:transmembrane protein 53 [Juglans microcarpa x Juglans regia]|uniref:transmembrane protein 53 n=1 Tax=Juglans microcarpa x Juglans regia TaxID=2249226 RepID=UPI001B7F688D|nr:transmembrane protein 53 [Juglans microcarpa x Juglans regia]XP_041011830.1 transmembrane protein 53 [Juglans microcarpa x Juglans regia]XP_041011831.1 transmembrane protein 53 [Juglans microcarpa x Juglans regia]XP_041011832.1 transmembrane protein 53 [Juglans microcarpa x Juglans regia]
MGSLSGILQRPLVAAAAVTVASVSADLSDKLPLHKSSDTCAASDLANSSVYNSLQGSKPSWVSHISVSKLANLSFVTRIRVPVPNINFPVPDSGRNFVPSLFSSSVASSPLLLNLYQSADLAKAPKPTAHGHSISNSPSEVMYRWHLPEPNAIDVSGVSDCSSAKSRTVVVLLGWLGAKQKHLNRYAEWYTSRGFHAITFTFPMAEILSYQFGGNAEEHIDLLVNHLAGWLEEEHGKNLVFHTFSNTGWLTYGVILEKLKKQDASLMGRIRGCIVDSAPVAAPDPQVWASGFSAAFLKKRSVATKGTISPKESGMEVLVGNNQAAEPKPAVTEAALLLLLEKFFEVVLNLPAINRRLSDVLRLLSSGQPSCPQLYIYSSADRVIPSGSVESFIKKQQKAGHEVRACNFVSTPHVDHFRNDPKLYSLQLTQFLEDCVLTCCKRSV